MTVALFGHRFISNPNALRKRLMITITNLIELGYYTFMVGYHGDFDKIALSMLRELKDIYSNIKIILVVTSNNFFVNDKLGYSLAQSYKDVEILSYPIEHFHFKSRITMNNRFMVDDCDLVLAYVNERILKSGARRAIGYARSINKKVINIYEDCDSLFYGLSHEQLKVKFKEYLKN